MNEKSTRQVTAMLRIKASTLTKAVWDGRVDEPRRSPAGNFLWDRRSIERACWVMLRKPLDAVLSKKASGGSEAK